MITGTLTRLAFGAALAATAIGAAPAMASAASACSYNTSNNNVIVTDNSGKDELQIVRVGEQIRIADGFGARLQCGIANVNNTEKIAVFATPANAAGGYAVDQVNGAFAPGATKEADGTSEIEISLDTTGVPAPLTVYGSSARDIMSVGVAGSVNLAYDLDADIVPVTAPTRVTLRAGLGNDDIDASGGGMLQSSTVPVTLEGAGGNDLLVGGPILADILKGGAGDDRMFSVHGRFPGGHDEVSGGSGNDTATTDLDDFVYPDVETWQIGRP